MITKKQFYSDLDVQEMACWVIKRFDDKSGWTHNYQRNGRDWNCNGLYDAFLKYEWDDTDWKNTKEELDAFRSDLREACKAEDDSRVVAVCEQILTWGGVIPHNNKYLHDHKLFITQELQHMKGLLSMDETPSKQDMCTFSNHPKAKYRMTAGFSKIYSLLCDHCVIYDSRVSAALCLLVRQFCEAERYETIPSNLKFLLSEARKTRKPKNRNPVLGSFNFEVPKKVSSSNPRRYTEQIMFASWFLRLALEKEPNVFSRGEDGFHELAAGLFMVGYDLRDT